MSQQTEEIIEVSDFNGTKEKRELILDALKNGCSIVRKIAQRTALEKGEILDELWALQGSSEVEKAQAGMIEAWFIKGTVPEGRLYLDSNGDIQAAKADIELPGAVVLSSAPVKSQSWKSTRPQNGNGHSTTVLETAVAVIPGAAE